MKDVAFASPNIKLEEWECGRKSDIDVFEDQLQGWVFDQAQLLVSRPRPASDHSGHALLTLISPYFEMMTCYLEGRRPRRRESTEFLRRGLKTVLGDEATDRDIKAFVREVRNGFAHELMFRTVVLHRENPQLPRFGIDPHYKALTVDPFWLHSKIYTHFKVYVESLRTPRRAEGEAALSRFMEFMSVRKAKSTTTGVPPASPGRTGRQRPPL